MKKLLVILFSVLLLGAVSGATFAYADTVSTDIYVPTQYLEYYELSSPIDFCMRYKNGQSAPTYAIAESSKIIIYEDDLFTVYPLNGYNISKICFYDDNHLLFINDNNICSFNIAKGELTAQQRIYDTDVDAQAISTINGRVVALKTKTFYDYDGAIEDGNVVLSNPNTFAQSNDNIVGLTLIDSKTWLYVSEGRLFRLVAESGASPEHITSGLGVVRYNTYHDGIYYFTSPDGIYAVDLLTKQLTQLSPTSTQGTLGSISEPKGIFYDNGYLYVCDSSLNAVCQFDIAKNSFTDFAITARADLDNRISFSATDIKTDGQKQYVLDGNKIKIFDSGKYLPALTIKLPGAFTDFAVISDSFLITNGANLYYTKQENGALVQKNILAELPLFNSISSITSYGDSFYFINNHQILSDVYTQVYRLGGNDLNTITLVKEIKGRGIDLCADIFGKLYIVINESANYTVQSFLPDDAATQATTLFTTPHTITALDVDFNCNVYALGEANNVFRIDAENSQNNTTFEIVNSKNIPSSILAKDIMLTPATNDIYALCSGFILKLNPTELGVASPENVAVPNDFAINFEQSFNAVTINSGAKVFEIDLSTALGDVFDYSGYTSYLGSDSFVLLYSDARYAIIVNDKLSAIVRNQDLAAHTIDKAESGRIGFAVTSGHIYTHPVLDECFRICALEKNKQVIIVDTFTFNGTTFATVSFDQTVGFVPLSMLKINVASDGSPYQFETKQVGKDGAIVYADTGLTNKIATVNAFEFISIYDQTDTLYLVKIGENYGYIEKSALGSKGKIVVRNVILITAIALSLLTTALFIIKRFILTKKEIE